MLADRKFTRREIRQSHTLLASAQPIPPNRFVLEAELWETDNPAIRRLRRQYDLLLRTGMIRDSSLLPNEDMGGVENDLLPSKSVSKFVLAANGEKYMHDPDRFFFTVVRKIRLQKREARRQTGKTILVGGIGGAIAAIIIGITTAIWFWASTKDYSEICSKAGPTVECAAAQ